MIKLANKLHPPLNRVILTFYDGILSRKSHTDLFGINQADPELYVLDILEKKGYKVVLHRVSGRSANYTLERQKRK